MAPDACCPLSSCRRAIGAEDLQRLQPGTKLQFHVSEYFRVETAPVYNGAATVNESGVLTEDIGDGMFPSAKIKYIVSAVGQNPRAKIVLFSQFSDILNWIGDRIIRRYGESFMAEYFGKQTLEALTRFRDDPECRLLSLRMEGAEGLDLSFVTHIFLVEPIMDRALLQQLVARAWRMGAKRSCRVVQVLMSETIEEDLQADILGGHTLEALATGALEVTASSTDAPIFSDLRAILTRSKLVRRPSPGPLPVHLLPAPSRPRLVRFAEN